MSHSATMFSVLTSCRSSPARLATPIMPMFSLSFGESFRAWAWTLTSQAPVAAAVCLMNRRRFRGWVIRREFLSRQFANVNVTEPDRHLVADHENIEMVPLARKIVRHLQWAHGILLIVEKPA